MSENKKNLSRRDALKLLGAAAGAVALANIPEKWSSPELAAGVLPAHAQTSVCYAVTVEILSGGFFFSVEVGPPPDETTGSTYAWYCQEGCLVIYLDLDVGNYNSGSVRVTTMAGTYIETYDTNGSSIRDISVILDTGAYASNPDDDPSQWICGTPPLETNVSAARAERRKASE